MTLKQRVLAHLWESSNLHQGNLIDLDEWANTEGIDQSEVAAVVNELLRAGLVSSPFIGMNTGCLTPRGIFFAETEGLVEPSRRDWIDLVRFKILKKAAETRTAGLHALMSTTEVVQESGLDHQLILTQSVLLANLGLLESPVSGVYRLSDFGLMQFEAWQEAYNRSDRYKSLLDGETSPQKRGHALEELLKEVAIHDGWNAEKNLRSVGEENDLILNKRFDYFIVSCKWVKDGVDSLAVRDLRERVTGRPKSSGVLVSATGFTSEAEQIAKERLESALIIFFGPQDLAKLFAPRHESLTDMFETKIESLMRFKKLTWE